MPMKGLRKRGHSWYYRIRAGRSNKEISLGRDEDIAIARVLEIRRRLASGKPLTDEKPTVFTVADAAREWIEGSVRQNRSERFARETESRVSRVLLPFMGKEKIENVTSRTLYAYRNWLSQRKHWRTKNPLAPLTIRQALSDCRAMLNHCLNVGLIERSPVPTRGWMPRIPERAPDRFTKVERDSLVKLPDPHGRVIRFLLASGVRWSELVRAQASDVQDSVLLVRKSKSGKVRRVPLPGPIVAECSKRVGRLCPFDSSGNFNSAVRELIAERLKKLSDDERKPLENLGRFRTHLCRHTFASEWRDAGGSLEALRNVLGHSTVRVTEIYGEASDDLVLREARRVWRK